MKHFQAIGRLGGLAIGLGFGAALAATPGIASADLPPFDPNDFAISIDGMTLFQVGTATATSGMGDFAIADGANSEANAGGADEPGQFDTAVADGANSNAHSGFGNFDSAFASGTHSDALALGAPGNLSNGDFGSAFGANSTANAGALGTGVPSENDVALVFDPVGSIGSVDEAGRGNADLASIVGDNSLAEAGFGGNFDLAEGFGNDLTSLTATGANFLTDIFSGPPF